MAVEEDRITSPGSCMPLLDVAGRANSADSNSPKPLPMKGSEEFLAESARVEADAARFIGEQSTALRQGATRSETSDTIREVCQRLADMATELTQTWRRFHRDEPPPPLPIEVVAEEELGAICWDFHANRVQMKNNESVFSTLWLYMKGDQEACYAAPPSSREALQALTKMATRLQTSSARR
eukprot:TRINITY_DN69052_c0_g1_i1.p1 TRINITY_DN69052_c0_g1~~TRINITY_DN69052_c0_g1_i1.p1  ORF type:complete len:182 (-),score=31.21 TRINITY_DN69052_c0_g1_i1:183-728(-)